MPLYRHRSRRYFETFAPRMKPGTIAAVIRVETSTSLPSSMRRPRTWSACTLSTPGITRGIPEDRGVVEYTEEVLVGLSDEFQELKKAIAANVQVVLKDDCTLCQWYMDYTGLMYSMMARGHCFAPELRYRYLAEAVPLGL